MPFHFSSIFWLLVACIVLLMGAVWILANSRGYRSRGRRRIEPPRLPPKSSRRSDQRVLTKQEKRLLAETYRMLKEGRVMQAAQIFEQLQMPREAIQTLEDAGMIHEAAKILIRMQRHNRAGVIYARHGMWDHAAKCFQAADMPLETARCAREARNFELAATCFAKAERWEDAARCALEAGHAVQALRMFLRAGLVDAALSAFDHIGREAGEAQALDLSIEEQALLLEAAARGRLSEGILSLLNERNQLPALVLMILEQGNVQRAKTAYTHSQNDLGPQVIADVVYQGTVPESLARMFTELEQHQYAGMVLERISEFERAAHAFELGDDLERATYCFERAGRGDQVKRLQARTRAPRASKRSNPENAFALASIEATSQFDEDQATAMLDRERTVTEIKADEIETLADKIITDDSDEQESEEEHQDELISALNASDQPPSLVFALSNDSDLGTPAQGTQSASEIPQNVADTTLRIAFHESKIIAGLTESQREKMWSIGEVLSFSRGENILTYDDDPQGLYVVLSGMVKVSRPQAGQRINSHEANGEDSFASHQQIGKSGIFGELWLLADYPDRLRCQAGDETQILVISRERFHSLLDRNGAIARKVYKEFLSALLEGGLTHGNYIKNREAS